MRPSQDALVPRSDPAAARRKLQPSPRQDRVTEISRTRPNRLRSRSASGIQKNDPHPGRARRQSTPHTHRSGTAARSEHSDGTQGAPLCSPLCGTKTGNLLYHTAKTIKLAIPSPEWNHCLMGRCFALKAVIRRRAAGRAFFGFSISIILAMAPASLPAFGAFRRMLNPASQLSAASHPKCTRHREV